MSGVAWKHSWGPWLLMRSSRYDLVAITGDLFASRVDNEKELNLQLKWLKIITEKLDRHTRMALGTGIGDEELLLKAAGAGWKHPDWRTLVPEVAVTDGMNQVVAGQKGRILVTVFGSLIRTGENACTRFVQWKQARQIAQTFNLPWLVLHPYGPTGSAVTQSFNPHTSEYDWLGSQNLGAEIERYQPDYVVCGCPDYAPFEGGHWCDRIGNTLILNPGCRPVGDFPCNIELDLERRRARWRVAGIEDGIVSLGEATGSSSENSQPSLP